MQFLSMQQKINMQFLSMQQKTKRQLFVVGDADTQCMQHLSAVHVSSLQVLVKTTSPSAEMQAPAGLDDEITARQAEEDSKNTGGTSEGVAVSLLGGWGHVSILIQ